MKTVFKTCLILFTIILFAGCAEKDGNGIRLSAPYSLRVSSDNVLTWSVVKGATAYLPNINGVDCAEVTSNQLDLHDVANGGHLVIKVKAIGNGTTVLDSEWSDPIEYNMAVPLDIPIPVVSGKIVTWEAVEGASKYEYNINGSIVQTDATTIDLSDYQADKYSIIVRAVPVDHQLNAASAWSSEVIIAIFDRLSTPVLTIVQPSLKTPEGASICWEPIEYASGYEVYIDDVKQECAETSMDFSGKSGTFTVKVTAVNPGLYESSETAVATITVKDYGKGTEAEPYMIYTASDWNDFVDMINEGISVFQDKYLELMSDIDFEGGYVKPAGKSANISFKGILDGNDCTLRNAKIGDGTTSHQAFFNLLNGTVKNINFDNITVTGGTDTGAASSAAVICAGNSSVAFTIENCHVTNSTVTSGDGGSYAGGLVGRCNNSSVMISGCSVSNSKITAGKENVGGIVGSFALGMLIDVTATGNTVTAEIGNNSGGVVGTFASGTATDVTTTGNLVSGKSNVGGVVGSMAAASLINVISTDNVSSVQTASCGGVVGVCTSADGKILNIFSDGNIVKCLNHSYAPYLGLIVGTTNNRLAYTIANTLTLSGSAEYIFESTDEKKTFAATVGIVMGYGVNAIIESGYYNKECQSLYDLTFYAAKGTIASTTNGLRLAVGVLQSTGTSDSKAGEEKGFVAKTADELKGTDVLNALNTWVETNKATYPSLKSWTASDNQYPKL